MFFILHNVAFTMQMCYNDFCQHKVKEVKHLQMKVNYDENPKILNSFLDYLQGIRGYTEETIKAYNSDLLQFFNFIKTYLEIQVTIKDFNIFILLQVKESDILAFLVYLNFTRNNTANTRQRKLCAVRRFYKWLLFTNPTIQKENPTTNIPNIERVIRLPKHLTLSQAQKIQEIFTLKNTKYPLRNNAIISLFLATGIRVGELININLKDIDFNTNSITVYGKGNKERIVYFNDKCKKKLLKYINVRNKDKKIIDINEPLFISYQHKRLGIDGVEGICEKAYILMGLENYGYTTHTLRHTAATLIYIYVAQDIFLLKKFLGHADVSTTEVYTHVYNKQVKQAVDKNPLNEILGEKAA